MNFDISSLITDCGGSQRLAKDLNVSRNVPYGWLRRSFISSTYLSSIKEVHPNLDINSYFVGETNGDERTKRST